jgi:hypothetical protein
MIYEKFAAGIEKGLEKMAEPRDLFLIMANRFLPPSMKKKIARLGLLKRPHYKKQLLWNPLRHDVKNWLFDKEWEETFVDRAAPIISDLNKLE